MIYFTSDANWFQFQTKPLFLRMAETTIPKDWAEVRAAVNLVERGVKVIVIIFIIIMRSQLTG